MTNIITTPSRALQVILSDTADIPTPYLITSGVATDDTVGQLVDENNNFIDAGVNIGDIVYLLDTATSVTIIGVTRDTLTFQEGATVTTGDTYSIYQQSPITGSQNQGCLLYFNSTVPNEGSLKVTTAGNDIVLFEGLSSGVLPVRVKKAWRDGRENNGIVIALW
jgi:hypothetical protein